MFTQAKAKMSGPLTDNLHAHSEKLDGASPHMMADIKEDVVGFTQNIKDVTSDTAHMAADYVHDRYDELKASGVDAVTQVEKRIKEKPAQSVAIAFAAGALVNWLFARRSR